MPSDSSPAPSRPITFLSMPADLNAILKIEVPVIVQVAQRNMTMKDVINLAPGSIIELPKLIDEDLDVLVNNQIIGRGAAVKVGENFGVRISTVGKVQQRVKALGGEK